MRPRWTGTLQADLCGYNIIRKSVSSYDPYEEVVGVYLCDLWKEVLGAQ